jgi:phage tail-like protein
MRPSGPTFWLLGRNYFGEAQNTLARTGVSVAVSGIRLAADPDPRGPVGLNSANGSLGGLVLPLGMAFGRDLTLYLLPPGGVSIARFDPRTKGFVALPGMGGAGFEARQFRDPANIAIAGRDLYVADCGNRRVQVFALGTLALRQVWEVDAADLTAWADTAYLLDRTHGRVFAGAAGSDVLVPILDEPGSAGKWTRIAVDRDGRLYLLDPAVPQLDVFDRSGRPLDPVREAGDVRDRFAPPAIRVDHKGRFCLPSSLMGDCGRAAPDPAPSAEAPFSACAAAGQVFDRAGQPVRVAPDEPAGPPIYRTAGQWISGALDSRVYRCQWHRIRLAGLEASGGTAVIISSYTDREDHHGDLGYIPGLPADQWQTRYRIAGAAQPQGPSERHDEFLVQSPEGQYLWLKIELAGDGYGTPAIGEIRVDYPRQSYLAYLPAVFGADDESRRFLEQFLGVFQTDWDGLEEGIATIAKYFDPKAVPDGPFMDYLAAWLALPLEGGWKGAEKRRLLEAAPRIYQKIGTRQGVRDYLRVYLENITQGAAAGLDGYPQVVEGFHERDHLMLSIPEVGRLTRLGHGAPLWSPAVVGRLQLGVYATEGAVRLVSTGDPERDIFHEYAHRFRVFVPSAWIDTAEDERMVRRAIADSKPAHTAYDLTLVEPRFRIGLQSTIGLDTIIGDYPAARLGPPNAPDVPPSRAPRGRLGIDTILVGAEAAPPAFHIGPTVRVGLDTILN